MVVTWGRAADAAASERPDSSRLGLVHETLKSQSGVRIEADGGRLMVPEHRGVPGSRSIPIGFLRLRSRAPSPRAPLFFLNGGPGNRGGDEEPRGLDFWTPFLDVCDVVLIDQRGTRDLLAPVGLGWSAAAHYFVSVDSANRHEGGDAPSRARRLQHPPRGPRRLHHRRERHRPRRATSSTRVREGLAARSSPTAPISLLRVPRRYGSRVENALLFGVEGPDQTQKLPWTMDTQFRKLALLVARDSTIGPRVPDLVALLDRVVARLEAFAGDRPGPEPRREGHAARAGRPVRPALHPARRRRRRHRPAGVPAAALEHRPRRRSVLAWFIRKRAGGALGVHGMNESMDAASGVSPGAASDDRGAVAHEPLRRRRELPVPHRRRSPGRCRTSATTSARPLVSPVRTLVVSGGLDFNTARAGATSCAGACRTRRTSWSTTPVTSRPCSRTTPRCQWSGLPARPRRARSTSHLSRVALRSAPGDEWSAPVGVAVAVLSSIRRRADTRRTSRPARPTSRRRRTRSSARRGSRRRRRTLVHTGHVDEQVLGAHLARGLVIAQARPAP